MFAFDDTDFKTIRKSAISLSILAIVLWRFGGDNIQLPKSVFEGFEPIPVAAVFLVIEIALVYLFIRLLLGFLAVRFSHGGVLKDRNQELEIAKALAELPDAVGSQAEEAAERLQRSTSQLSIDLHETYIASKDAVENISFLADRLDALPERVSRPAAGLRALSGVEVSPAPEVDSVAAVFSDLQKVRSELSPKLKALAMTASQFTGELRKLQSSYEDDLKKLVSMRRRAQGYPMGMLINLVDARILAFLAVSVLTLVAIVLCGAEVHWAGGLRSVLANLMAKELET